MSLQNEIDAMRAEIRTDGYAMSIGEWISLYEKSELDIHPEFQRFFRWTPTQKSRFIESILLGIPIPSIFVYQRQDGIWDVVDGLQRLSTIFELVGILKNEDNKNYDLLHLQGTKYLPSLDGKVWEDEENPENCFDPTQRLLIKRTKLYANIVLRESDEKAKYELFQRLNTGGSPLSDQEVRNCILVMMNKKFYFWLKNLAEDENFKECISLSEKNKEEQYDLELILRFIIFRTLPEGDIKVGDLNDFLTEQMIKLAENDDFNYDEEENAFRSTFRILANSAGSGSFKRYEIEKGRFVGGFLLSAYEVVTMGIGYSYASFKKEDELNVTEKIIRLWSMNEYTQFSGSGVRASSRIPRLAPLGRRLFRP